MSLPPWKASGPEDREAFAGFIIAELDAELHARFGEGLNAIAAADPADLNPAARIAFVRAIAEGGFPPAILERIGQLFGMDIAEIADQIERLQSIGFEVKASPGKRGVKSDHTPAYQNAADDVPRIRALFLRHWGKRNRHERPLAEEIAALRWGLSKHETADLIDKFQRKR